MSLRPADWLEQMLISWFSLFLENSSHLNLSYAVKNGFQIKWIQNPSLP